MSKNVCKQARKLDEKKKKNMFQLRNSYKFKLLRLQGVKTGNKKIKRIPDKIFHNSKIRFISFAFLGIR